MGAFDEIVDAMKMEGQKALMIIAAIVLLLFAWFFMSLFN